MSWSGVLTLGFPIHVCPIVVPVTDNNGTLPLSIPADQSRIGLMLHLPASTVLSIPPLVHDHVTTNDATIVVE